MSDEELADRRWELVDAEKLLARAERFSREGPEGCVRAAEALRRSGPPADPAERAADLRRHIRWRLLLDEIDERAGRAR
ncbi:MAG: hypothetical protein KF729_13990 [Sandaracinaceae bacterium]|nr:hypothetical protein [Sandaracinaceae bacterium]